LVTGICLGCFYALVATALQVGYASTRIPNFAQGEFAVGGMFMLWSLWQAFHVNLLVSLVLVLLGGFVLGVVFEWVAVRTMFNSPPMIAAMAGFAAGIILRGVYNLIYGPVGNGMPPFLDVEPVRLGSVVIGSQYLLVVVGAVIAFAAVYSFQRYTWIGRAMIATAENREGAAVVGINPRAISVLAFGINGVLSAAAGALMAPILGARYDFGLQFGLYAFIAGTLGGLTSIVGSAIGGLLVGITASLIAAMFGSEYQSVWLLLLFAALLYFRPNGLFGRFIRH
jgi:branched-chain amino acid transport system permease protein